MTVDAKALGTEVVQVEAREAASCLIREPVELVQAKDLAFDRCAVHQVHAPVGCLDRLTDRGQVPGIVSACPLRRRK